MRDDPHRWRVHAEQVVAYDVVCAPRLFAPTSAALLHYLGRPGGRRFVVLDSEVDRYFGADIRRWFAARGIVTRIIRFDAGEVHKGLASWERVLHDLNDFPIHRRDEPIVAIGGGVLTDVVGFAAACYRRGVPHINIPTTLMGYVDAAIGIKSAVNFHGAKNRLGSFAPPAAVLLDPTFLATLPRRHLLNGTCEILKLAVIADRALFERLERDGEASIATGFSDRRGQAILDRAIGGMLAELAPNLWERELARKVDFGHTFSGELETLQPARLLHGEAVLLDILVCVRIAHGRGLLATDDLTRICALIAALGLKPQLDALDPSTMWRSLLDRIDHRNGQQRVPVPTGIGTCEFLHDITRAELDAAITTLQAEARNRHAVASER